MRLRRVNENTDSDWERDEIEFANHRVAMRVLRKWLLATAKNPYRSRYHYRDEAQALFAATTPAKLKGMKR